MSSSNVLVASSSRHGATEELARMLAATMSEQGLTVEVRRMEDVDTVFPYDALVLGSAVYMGRWTPEARAFVEQHENGIVTRPTWLFSSGPIGDFPGTEPFDAGELIRVTGAREHHLFEAGWRRARLGCASARSHDCCTSRPGTTASGPPRPPGRRRSLGRWRRSAPA